jgi:DNA-binding CsgD family transcriptional regulator
VDREGSLAIFLGFRAEAAALLGQVDHARALIAEGWDALGPHSCYEYCLQRAEVWALVADGRVLEAIDATLAVADGHAERPGLAAFALHDAVRLGAADRVADRLTSLAATLPEPGLVTTWAAQARAAADGDGAALEQAADSLAASGLRLWAAEAAAQAAAAHEATGDAPGARRAALRSEEWADACGRPATPALARRLPRLTRREEEVARLAARGLSNAEIGERLFVSARTVENHLAHVYDKLGVRGRRALAAEIGVDHS